MGFGEHPGVTQRLHPAGRLTGGRAALAAMAATLFAPAPALAFCDALGLVAGIETAAVAASQDASVDALSTLEARLDQLDERRDALNDEAFQDAVGGVDVGAYLAARREFARNLQGGRPSPSTFPAAAPEGGRLTRLMESDAMVAACPGQAAAFREAAATRSFAGLMTSPPDAPVQPRGATFALASSASDTPAAAEEPGPTASAITERLSALADQLGDESHAALIAAFALAGFAAPLAVRATLRMRRRREPRHLCYLDASVKSETGSLSTHIVDISRAGARIATKNLVANGDRVKISLEGVARDAQVVWTKPSFGGVLFDEPLSRREMTAVLSAAKKGAGTARQE